MGLDNYFRSPFYIINNVDPKWNAFNKIKTEEAFHTDSLSIQYFSLMASAGLDHIDKYKRLIFDNTRAILNMVPEGLKPAPDKDVCICDFDADVKTPFIDIKIHCADLDQREELRVWTQRRFVEIFTEENKLVYRRGSFGFLHPNITWIDPKMRINPGLDPDENALYLKFFAEFETKVTELTSPDTTA